MLLNWLLRLATTLLAFLHILFGLALVVPASLLGLALTFMGLGVTYLRFVKRPVKDDEVVDYLEPETVEFLACDAAGGTRRTIANVPWRRRSVRLIFQATKAQVCRPFAR
jgi:hypothetical protein